MADYWISQTRKYCEFCKCWITDNRPSVDFHEKGRRHQENIKKRLRTITRQSNQTQKNADKVDATLRQMETAALAAYQKDVENNADLTSLAINGGSLSLSACSSSSSVKKLWKEVKQRDGSSSYVNIMTNETVWRPPKEGYASLAEQNEQAYLEAKKQISSIEKLKRQEGLKSLQEIEQQEAEDRARAAREKMKARRVVTDDIPSETCGPLLEPGKTDPYGKWQVVKESTVVDFQLPQQEQYYYEAPVELEPEPVMREFKEKTVESLGKGDANFKKRKFGGAVKRNTRQRVDDD